MAKGCDTTETLSTTQLTALSKAGYTFVCRYINGGWKQMYKEEAKRISAAGFQVVSLYQEYNNSASRFSYDIGVSQATNAVRLATDLTQPKNTPIYFAVDFDATRDELLNSIVPFFKGVKEVFNNTSKNPNGYKIGVYGSNMVCSYIKGTTTDRYTMVAAASSGWGGNKDYTHDNWNLKQTDVDKTFSYTGGSIEIDYCESSQLGGGGWKI